MKKLRVAINGFGRIGRNVLRAYLEYHDEFQDIEIVAINDVVNSDALLHLLKFDSTHGKLSDIGVNATIETICADRMVQSHRLVISKKDTTWTIYLSNEINPKNLTWREMDIDVVLECTGQFREYERANWHRQAGAKQVIIGAAPFDKVDASVVVGVNDDILSQKLAIVSGVSCTTQALVPLLAVMDKAFGVESVMLTEIHAVTADQTVLDSGHRDLRRARASGFNIIPTTSSSIAATERVLPNMLGKIDGHSIRVPTQNVAAIDVNLVLKNSVNVQTVNETLKRASHEELQGVMDYGDEPLVSSDFIHNRHSLTIDGLQTMQIGTQTKIFAWYDNEWGYANRLLDMCQKIAKNKFF